MSCQLRKNDQKMIVPRLRSMALLDIHVKLLQLGLNGICRSLPLHQADNLKEGLHIGSLQDGLFLISFINISIIILLNSS